MAGKKGMKHFGDDIIEEVLQMKNEGKTNREISKYYGFKDTLQIFFKRRCSCCLLI